MSLGTSSSKSNSQATNNFAEMGPEEKAMAERMKALGMSQADAIQYVLDQSKGGAPINTVGLNATDQAALDQAYAGAEQNLRRFGNLMGQDLAGTRGLNPSDTPVSEAVLRETLPAYANLMSNKAQYGLGLGLNLAQLNEGKRQFNLGSVLSGSTAMPTGLGFGLNRMQNERMARNTQVGSSLGYNSDSVMTQVGQGAAAYNQAGQGTASFAKAFAMMSDKRLKRDITPVSWNWKTGGNEQLGVIAQDVQRSHPHLVQTDVDGLLMVDYGAMTALLLSEREWLYEQLAQCGTSVQVVPEQERSDCSLPPLE